MGLVIIGDLVSVVSMGGATVAEDVAAVSEAAGPICGKNSCPFLLLFYYV